MDTAKYTIVTGYLFVTLSDLEDLKQSLLTRCERHQIKGTILLATEGMNLTLAGSYKAIVGVVQHIKQDPRFADMLLQYSSADECPFSRMRVRIKSEIVKLGLLNIDPKRRCGISVAPQDWNALISSPDVLLIDTRNAYEYKIGTFKGAINPDTQGFTEFPRFVKEQLITHKKQRVAMFCTGGVRCEKASSFMLDEGFVKVYQLSGGILNYLQQIPQVESLWQGECFVFDDRLSVDHALQPGHFALCSACHDLVAKQDTVQRDEIDVICLACYT